MDNSHTSNERAEEATPGISQDAPSEDFRSSFARELVAEAMRDGLLNAIPAVIAAGLRSAAPLVNTERQDKPPSPVPATTTPKADEILRPPENGVVEGEQQHQQEQQQSGVHGEEDSGARDIRCSDTTGIVSSAPGVVTSTRVPSPTLPTTTDGRADATHASGLHYVLLPTTLPHDSSSSSRPEAPIAGVAAEPRARSPAAATVATATANPEDRRCTPPSSRKRFRNGTFVRITNIPVKIETGAEPSVQLDAADHGRTTEARARDGYWQPSPTSLQSPPRNEGPATATAAAEPRPRPRTALQQGVVGVGGGGVRGVPSRPSDVEVKREVRSAGVARSGAGLGIEARNRSRGAARVQLRRNRWCSPSVAGDSRGLDLEGSVTSLDTTPSCGARGGVSSRERIPFPAASRDIHPVSFVDEATPRRPPSRGQTHSICDVPADRAGRGTAAASSGIDDGDLTGTTRTIYGVAIGGAQKGEGGAKQAAGEEEIANLSPTESVKRMFPPMSYRYKNHVPGSGPQGRTELSAAAANVTAAAAAAVAAAAAAAERSEREALFWRNCSESFRAEGAQSCVGSGASAEHGIMAGILADGARPGGWKAAAARPKPPTGKGPSPPANSRPGRTFTQRP
eukprot:g13730.t1